jgi:hypothetical protein
VVVVRCAKQFVQFSLLIFGFPLQVPSIPNSHLYGRGITFAVSVPPNCKAASRAGQGRQTKTFFSLNETNSSVLAHYLYKSYPTGCSRISAPPSSISVAQVWRNKCQEQRSSQRSPISDPRDPHGWHAVTDAFLEESGIPVSEPTSQSLNGSASL